MSLFVGNISRNVSYKDLDKQFVYYGPCKIDQRGSFAFVEYEREADAEDAKAELHDKNMGGLRINIEWSKRSGKFDPKATQGRSNGRRDRKDDDSRRRRRSRSDSRGRGRKSSRKTKSRSGSRDEKKKVSRSRSRSNSRRRERKSPRYSMEKFSQSKSPERRSDKHKNDDKNDKGDSNNNNNNNNNNKDDKNDKSKSASKSKSRSVSKSRD